MSILPLLVGTQFFGTLPLAEKASEEGAGWTPYYVGGGALVVFVILILAMLAFGKGREHS
jgi:hypothetical protein